MTDIDALFPSKWLKAGDVPPAGLTLTIASWHMEDMDDGQKKPCLMFHESQKGMILNKTNGALIAHGLGSNVDAWVGQRIQLHVEAVTFQGRVVDAIRAKAAPQAPQTASQPVPGQPAPYTPPPPQQAPPAPQGGESVDHTSAPFNPEDPSDPIPW